jgi:hypothetical protein
MRISSIIYKNNIKIFSNISVLLVEAAGVPGENERPVTSHCQTL